MIAAFAGPLEQQPSGYSDGAAPLFEATHSPGAAEHNSGAAARAAAAAAVGGGGEAGMSEFAQEGAWQGSPDSDASLQRVASGASASTSGEGEGLSQGRCRQSLRERARAEAIGVYGERYCIVLTPVECVANMSLGWVACTDNVQEMVLLSLQLYALW